MDDVEKNTYSEEDMEFPVNSQNLLIMASTLRIVGEILIVVVLFSLHNHIMKEQRIDGESLAVMSREKLYITVGLTALILGYIVELYARTRGYL